MPDLIRMSLELESVSPIRGHVVDDRARARPFAGWLELTSAIEAAAERMATAPEPAAEPTPSMGAREGS